MAMMFLFPLKMSGAAAATTRSLVMLVTILSMEDLALIRQIIRVQWLE